VFTKQTYITPKISNFQNTFLVSYSRSCKLQVSSALAHFIVIPTSQIDLHDAFHGIVNIF